MKSCCDYKSQTFVQSAPFAVLILFKKTEVSDSLSGPAHETHCNLSEVSLVILEDHFFFMLDDNPIVSKQLQECQLQLALPVPVVMTSGFVMLMGSAVLGANSLRSLKG